MELPTNFLTTGDLVFLRDIESDIVVGYAVYNDTILYHSITEPILFVDDIDLDNTYFTPIYGLPEDDYDDIFADMGIVLEKLILNSEVHRSTVSGIGKILTMLAKPEYRALSFSELVILANS